MATEYLFSNNATTTLAQSVSSTATVLNVESGDGDLFPSPSTNQAFAVTLVDAATGLVNEICYCTSRSGDQLTVTRGEEGTNATSWLAGDTCANYITADVIESWLQESDLSDYATLTDLSDGLAEKEDVLGFTPVQQGGGTNQTTDKVCIGNSTDGNGVLRYSINSSDGGPIVSGLYGAVTADGDYPVYGIHWTEAGRPVVGWGSNANTATWTPIATYADVTTETTRAKAAESTLSANFANYVPLTGDVTISGPITFSGTVGFNYNVPNSGWTKYYYGSGNAYNFALQQDGNAVFYDASGNAMFSVGGSSSEINLDLPVAGNVRSGTVSGGTYTVINDVMTQYFTVTDITAADTQTITFPISFSGNPYSCTVTWSDTNNASAYANVNQGGLTSTEVVIRARANTSGNTWVNSGGTAYIVVSGPV